MAGDEGYGRAKTLFLEASRLPRGARTDFLRLECGEDLALERRVRRLLTLDGQDEGFLETPALAEERPSLAPGTKLGGFRIVRLLGEGGMGVVYEAQEDVPDRRVALKLIRPGLFAGRLRARFRHEIRVLGQLRHPGIAQIYEAGTVEHGDEQVPYFAMELVDGEPLVKFAARRGMQERLALLAQVCDAVHHAHQKGVIHRDLKPGNILVEEAPTSSGTGESGTLVPFQVKVLDFGVSRAMGADAGVTSAHTNAGQLVGTLPYMSPEQAAGDPDALDTRSDVYSIGVIACEVLIGRLPYEVEGKGIAEAARVIREQEPVRLGACDRAMRGDVETIVHKALQKDRKKRYQSAAEFAADIRRYLRDEPIIARAPSALYHLGKFARRHRALVGAAAAVVVSMAGATGVSAWQARVALTAKAAAEAAKTRADASAAAARRGARRATLAAAAAAIEGGDPISTKRLLDGTDEAGRDWAWRYWQSRLDCCVAVVQPGGSIADAWLTPDGAELVTITADGIVRRGSPWAGELSETCRIDDTGVPLAVLIDNGTKVVTNGGNRRVPCLFSCEDGRLLRRGEPFEASAGVLLASADGGVVCAGLNRPGRPRSDVLVMLHGHNVESSWASRDVIRRSGSSGSALSADGRWLAMGLLDVVVADTETMTRSEIARVERGGLEVAISGDGAFVAAGGEDKIVRVWDRNSKALVCSLVGHAGAITALAIDESGDRLASAGRDLTIRLWDTRRAELLGTLTGHTDLIKRLQFTPDGSLLLSVSTDGSARIWRQGPFEDTCVLRGHTSYVYAAVFTPDGKRIISGAWDETVRFWDAAGGAARGAFKGTGRGYVTSIAVSPDGKRIVTGHIDARLSRGRVLLWDAEAGSCLGELASEDGAVGEVAFGADSRKVWIGWDEYGVEEIELSQSPPVRRRVVEGTRPRAVAVGPSGGEIAVGDSVGSITLRSPATGQTLRTLSGHRGWITGLAFHPTRNVLASASADGTARLWDLDSGQCVRVLEGHWDKVYAVAFSPDGRRLATGSDDTTILLWDVEDLEVGVEELTRLRGHGAYVYALAFSPDGTRLVSASGDHTVRVWDTRPVHERWRSRHGGRGATVVSPGG